MRKEWKKRETDAGRATKKMATLGRHKRTEKEKDGGRRKGGREVNTD